MQLILVVVWHTDWNMCKVKMFCFFFSIGVFARGGIFGTVVKIIGSVQIGELGLSH